MSFGPRFRALALAVTAALALPACSSGAPGIGEGPIGTTPQAEEAENALTLNALTLNALTLNALTLNALTLNALTLNALTQNNLLLDDLTDPNARETLRYIVGCALPANQTITLDIQGQTYDFPGQLGLASEWGEPGSSCDGKCQQWVSACVISRLDYLGEPLLISLRGENPGLKTTKSERTQYTDREATYYGDIFLKPMKLYACLAPGKTQIPRVCGPSIATCGVDVLGQCEDLCGHPRGDGAFPDCRVPDADDGWWRGHHDGDDVMEGSITVYDAP